MYVLCKGSKYVYVTWIEKPKKNIIFYEGYCITLKIEVKYSKPIETIRDNYEQWKHKIKENFKPDSQIHCMSKLSIVQRAEMQRVTGLETPGKYVFKDLKYYTKKPGVKNEMNWIEKSI